MPEAEFRVIEGGSQRGGKILVENVGYTYTIKKRSRTTTSWICSVRNKRINRGASVYEMDMDISLTSDINPFGSYRDILR